MGRQIFNPFLPEDVYIPDGEPHVFGDRIYLFGSHDKEGGDSFCLLDYEGWSASIYDLSKWESAGVIYSAKQDPMYSEVRPYMYAPDVVQGNDGKFYLYYCLAGWRGNGGYDGPISVAVSDNPNGKYEYYGYVRHSDGTIFQDCVLFDPAVMNDNGIIRLYTGTELPWGWEITRWNRLLTVGMAERMYHRPKSNFKGNQNPLGAYTMELEDDMLTVRGNAIKILPRPTFKNGFKGHAFFEAASIRKVGEYYYFIYSSQKNHELCYAVSEYPDRDFHYGGTIISNGDVGYNERKEVERLNTTGTTHGSIECIDGQWYVFYHRLSHGSDYSRQACAEPITIDSNGKISQVEVTSSGLNNGPLELSGRIPAIVACNITNGKMPHISNQKCEKIIPMVTHEGQDHFITNVENNVVLGYKYFTYTNECQSITLVYRGNGSGVIKVYQDLQQKEIGCLSINETQQWNKISGIIKPELLIAPLYLRFEGVGSIDILELSFD